MEELSTQQVDILLLLQQQQEENRVGTNIVITMKIQVLKRGMLKTLKI